MPFLSHKARMYPLESVKTKPDDSSTTAYRFYSPTGSQIFVLLSRKASAGIARSFEIELRYDLADSTRF